MADIGVAEWNLDLELGARFTSLRSADGYEWLWSNPRSERTAVDPGSGFVDAGGAEECFPTIAGQPDHGFVWSEPWTPVDCFTAFCDTPDARLTRTVTSSGPVVLLRYRVEADPGYRFDWAFHALVTPDPNLILDVLLGEAVLTWPGGYHEPSVLSRWPQAGAVARFDDMTADDKTAQFALLPERSAVTIQIGSRSLGMALNAPSAPTAIGIWRNLGGYAWDGGEPYRSIGIEPMLGRNPRLGSGTEAAVVPDTGTVDWALSITLSD